MFMKIKHALHTTVESATVRGRISKKSTIKNFIFVQIFDDSTVELLQVVLDKKLVTDKLTNKSIISVTGKLQPGKDQKNELKAESYKIIQMNNYPGKYPITEQMRGETIRKFPHLQCQTRLYQAIELIKSSVMRSFRKTMDDMSIDEIEPVILTGNECEEGAHPFKVIAKDHFGKDVYLTVSSQLHLEALACSGMRDLYCWTKAFRAEPSTGPIHMSEFSMPEVECMFNSLEENMQLVEQIFHDMFGRLLDQRKSELEYVNPGISDTLVSYRQGYKRVTHEECIRRMLESGDEFDTEPKYDDDLSRQHEYWITREIGEGKPVFVTHFPQKVKAFYMPVVDPDAEIKRVDCFDLLFPDVGEVVGGSQRIHKYEDMPDIKDLEWYKEVRKFGCLPHGGFGLGFIRVIHMLTGMNARDVTPFQRSYKTQVVG